MKREVRYNTTNGTAARDSYAAAKRILRLATLYAFRCQPRGSAHIRKAMHGC